MADPSSPAGPPLPPTERLAEALASRGLTLAVAESCSGGLLSAAVTDRPGASAYFLGGVVAYADEVKVRTLGVERSLLAEHGAVSGEVAEAMARGAQERFGTAVAGAITGIAGPGGGTAEKPVGLVYAAAASPAGVRSRRHLFRGGRGEVRAASVDAAAELLLAALGDAAASLP